MNELKTFIEDNLLKSNGALNGAKMKQELFPTELWDELQRVEGFDLRDKLLMASRGPMKCAGCGVNILPYPRYINGDKLTYCGKECMPKAPVYEKNCVICGNGFTTRIEGVQTCSKKCAQELKKKTSLERYGVEWGSQSPEVKANRENTNREKYGVKHAIAAPETRQKIMETMVERYGSHNMQSPEWMAQHRETFQKSITKAYQVYKDKNGYQSPMHDPSFHENIRNRGDYRLMYNIEWWNDNYIPCVTSIRALAQKFGVRPSNLGRIAAKLGVEIVQPMRSAREMELAEFVASMAEIRVSDRTIIAPYELDIYAPEHNFAIEVNGSYWHSEEYLPADYHVRKTEMCAEKGITLLHVWDYDDLEKIKGMILSKLGRTKRIFARKCRVGYVDRKEAIKFFNDNHIQGNVHAPVYIGLYDGDRVVMCASFGKPRFDNNHSWELLRMASISGTTVVGGVSRLLKYFFRAYEGGLVSYSDISRGFNSSLEKAGMVRTHISKPGFVWTDGESHLKRYKTQKHKLSALLCDFFNPDMTEKENMERAGYSRLFDCGQEIFTMR